MTANILDARRGEVPLIVRMQEMVRAAIGLARDHGCVLVQLTTDKSRKEAHRFYERLGFVSTHEGMKLDLN